MLYKQLVLNNRPSRGYALRISPNIKVAVCFGDESVNLKFGQEVFPG